MTWMLVAALVGCGFLGSAPSSEPAGGDPPASKRPKREAPTSPRSKKRRGRPTADFQVPSDPCAEIREGVTAVYTHTFEGETLQMPLSIGPSTGPRALVVLLHGGRGGAPSILKKTRLDQKALEEGFVVVSPVGMDMAGRGARWNTGKFDAALPPGTDVRDDVAFLDSLAAALQKDACVDRVYAFGFSSGGQMANRWNCEGDQIDGAIGAAGSLLVPVANCKGPRPMLAMVGTKDDNFREGSTESALSTPDSLETHWGQINQCSGKGTDTDVGDARCTTLKGCAAPTQLCVVKGGAHDVPAPFSEKHPTTFDGPDYGWSFLTSTN